MSCTETLPNLDWLLSQQRMLSLWMAELKKEPFQSTAQLVEKLEEHERWLSQSIRELTDTNGS